MWYLLIKCLHLTAAAFFIGGVFFEIAVVSRAARQLEPIARAQFSSEFGQRARQVMPWVIFTLYGAGALLADHYYRDALAHPFASSLGTLLSVKILLAVSILGHFIAVMVLMKRGHLTPRRSHWIHRSVFLHMIGILFLAKAMFLFQR